VLGDHFVMHRFEGHVGGQNCVAIDVIGTPESAELVVNGIHYVRAPRPFRWSRDGAGWSATGAWHIRKQTFPAKGFLEPTKDRNVLRGTWDIAAADGHWVRRWDLRYRRRRS
jgi:hypothetical protein